MQGLYRQKTSSNQQKITERRGFCSEDIRLRFRMRTSSIDGMECPVSSASRTNGECGVAIGAATDSGHVKQQQQLQEFRNLGEEMNHPQNGQ